MSGFEKTPNALLDDLSISLSAKAVYPILLRLAWQAGRRADEEVELPPLPEVAAACGVGKTALKDYLAELREAGWLTTIRASRTRPQRYVIRSIVESRIPAFDETAREPESGPPESRNPALSRARLTGEPQTKEPDRGDSVSPTSDDPPKVVLVDGRNLGFDALAGVCGYDPGRRQDAAEIAVALNGSRKTGAGIRAEFWGEVAAVFEDVEARRFEASLAAEVEVRAALYRRKMPGATLTPTALAKWWGRLPAMPDGDRRVTADRLLRGPL